MIPEDWEVIPIRTADRDSRQATLSHHTGELCKFSGWRMCSTGTSIRTMFSMCRFTSAEKDRSSRDRRHCYNEGQRYELVRRSAIFAAFLKSRCCSKYLDPLFELPTNRTQSLRKSCFNIVSPERSMLHRLLCRTTSSAQSWANRFCDVENCLRPTRAEQEAIAEALSDADAFIDSLEQLIVKKRRLKQGAMQELLTGKKRLPGFKGEWRQWAIERLLTGSSELRR